MTKFLGKFGDEIYALLRIVAGYLFACHGAQKIFGVLGGEQEALASMAGLAGVIELVGGLLILLGLFTSWAAFIASGEMAVGYFMVHASQGAFLTPINNDGELAVVYCFLFLFMAAHGAGKWSVAAATGKSSLE